VGKFFRGIQSCTVPVVRCATKWNHCRIVFVCVFVFYLLSVTGCGPALSPPEQVREFERAGPIIPGVGVSGLGGMRTHTGPYRIVPGDILEFQMPAILWIVSADLSGSIHRIEPYLCRVSDVGTIAMPVVGEIPVAGRRLAEVETLVVDAYFPKYVVNTPMVVCKLAEQQDGSERVFTVMGLVNRPGTFRYPVDVQYNLMEAVAFAGGFDLVADPRYVKIYRQNAGGDVVSATFGINNEALADAYNVIVKPGDVIYIDHTMRTRINTFLSNVLSIGIGVDARYKRF